MGERCGNPPCATSVRYLKEGSLFRLESEPASRTSKCSRVECFWLYQRCFSAMTLHLGEDGAVITVPLPELASRVPDHVALRSKDRGRGRLLRCIGRLDPISERLQEHFQEHFQKERTMRDDWEEFTAEVAAGAICPTPGCGAIGIAFRPRYAARSGYVESWEFTCPQCHIDFMAAEQQFVFQSVPKEWLPAGIQAA